jgi:hypothetical protein
MCKSASPSTGRTVQPRIYERLSARIPFFPQLLKIVNSTFYGFPSKIDTLSRAVTIVGTKQLSTLALGMNIIKLFRRIPSNLIKVASVDIAKVNKVCVDIRNIVERTGTTMQEPRTLPTKKLKITTIKGDVVSE